MKAEEVLARIRHTQTLIEEIEYLEKQETLIIAENIVEIPGSIEIPTSLVMKHLSELKEKAIKELAVFGITEL